MHEEHMSRLLFKMSAMLAFGSRSGKVHLHSSKILTIEATEGLRLSLVQLTGRRYTGGTSREGLLGGRTLFDKVKVTGSILRMGIGAKSFEDDLVGMLAHRLSCRRRGLELLSRERRFDGLNDEGALWYLVNGSLWRWR